jgi:succinate dehydrogenase (ubiquinone) cytochrome b560 subunit
VTGIGALALFGCDVSSCLSTLGNITLLGHAVKFGVSFPLVYHYMGGVRHLIWDKTPEMLENDKVDSSSKMIMGAAAVVSLGISFL